MFSPLHMKTLQVSSAKSSSSSSSSSSALSSTTKLKAIHTIIASHFCRLFRALSKIKTLILDIIRDDNYYNYSNPKFPLNKRCSKTNKIILGSFRLHYNWCSSDSSRVVLPLPSRVCPGLPPATVTGVSVSASGNNNSTNTEMVDGGGGEDWDGSELAGYLQWLEEKVDCDYDNEKGIKDIDELAEVFIANCHEKFRLEKQESDRKFHDMLARGA